MDIKELLKTLAEFDEMEAPDGMNVSESVHEEFTEERDIEHAIHVLEELIDDATCKEEIKKVIEYLEEKLYEE